MADFRKTFHKIPEDFDKYRPRYREEVFQELKELCKLDSGKRVVYENALHYGFTNFIYKEWQSERVLNAEEYISWIGTHCAHITLEDPYKTHFYSGVREAFGNVGDRMAIIDTIPLYLFQKPL